ncbi:MAG: hypothetical protein AMJ92_07595 [candidate division Zixibacteria bacterium SM23_81]|nr:MAG: hypothetical protein AMJ92_07595 [candidate division Zixibacteria bacterium SM23_81]
MFISKWDHVVEEVQEEQHQWEARSYQALRNMLGYCQARVIQLADQRRYLDFQSRQQHDLFGLLETWQRLERVQHNFRRFSEKCLLIKVEIARRENRHREKPNRGQCYET